MKSIRHIVIILLGLLLLNESCSYKKRNILFKTPHKLESKQPVYIYDSDSNKAIKSNDTVVYKHRIKIGDRLNIRFLQNYDLGEKSGESATSNQANSGADQKGYLVNYDSSVTLPLIGRLNLVGLTRLDASKRLEEAYGKIINDPMIEINIVNLSVNVLGDVVSPGKIYVDKENTMLVEVIALAGGFRDGSKKNTVQIIREGKVIMVNMQQISTAFDERTIIHDNDIVYVQPYGIKADLEPISVATSAISPLLTVLQVTLISMQIYLMFRVIK